MELIAGAHRTNGCLICFNDGAFEGKRAGLAEVPYKLFEGTDAEALIARAKENNRPANLKVPNTASVLATEARQMDAAGVPIDLIKDCMPPERVRDMATLHGLLRWPDVAAIAAVSIGLAFLATLYPSFAASRVKPAEALRYE